MAQKPWVWLPAQVANFCRLKATSRCRLDAEKPRHFWPGAEGGVSCPGLALAAATKKSSVLTQQRIRSPKEKDPLPLFGMPSQELCPRHKFQSKVSSVFRDEETWSPARSPRKSICPKGTGNSHPGTHPEDTSSAFPSPPVPSSPTFSPEFHISHSPIAWDRN